MIYVRNMRGYGQHPPDAKWPGDGKIAVQFVLKVDVGLAQLPVGPTQCKKLWTLQIK